MGSGQHKKVRRPKMPKMPKWDPTKKIVLTEEDISKATALLNAAIIDLVRKKPFYAAFIQQFNRTYMPLVGPQGQRFAAGVTFQNMSPVLMIDPGVWNTLPLNSQKEPTQHIAILEHEVSHVIMLHLLRAGTREPQIWNYAADMAVNQYISGLPDWVVTCESAKLPKGKTAEYYYSELMKNVQVVKVKCSGGGVDSHAKWSEAGKGKGKDKGKCTAKGAVAQQATEELMKQVIKDMTEQAYSKARGLIPGGLEVDIQELLKLGQLPWYMILRMFFATSQKVTVGRTFKRENRRFGAAASGETSDIEFPGNRKSPKLKIACIIDTSGSVSDLEINEFFGEMDLILRNPMVVMDIIECDAAVHKVYKYDGRNRPRKISGRGGTAFQPGLDEVYNMKMPPDGIIYFTDGYNCGEHCKAKKATPVLWIISHGGNTKMDFGKVIEMPEAKDFRHNK